MPWSSWNCSPSPGHAKRQERSSKESTSRWSRTTSPCCPSSTTTLLVTSRTEDFRDSRRNCSTTASKPFGFPEKRTKKQTPFPERRFETRSQRTSSMKKKVRSSRQQPHSKPALLKKTEPTRPWRPMSSKQTSSACRPSKSKKPQSPTRTTKRSSDG